MLVPTVIVAVALTGQVPPVSPPPPVAAPAGAQTSGTPASHSRAYYEFVLARHLEGEGRIDEAIAALRRAASADPAAAEILAELAGLFARQNRADEAIAAANQALAIDAGNVEAHWVLGTVYAALVQSAQGEGQVKAADLDRAIGHLSQARTGRRYDLGLVLTLGRLYLVKPDHQSAIEALTWVRDREPGIAEANYMLAQAHEGAGQTSQAIDVLREAVSREPRFFRAWVLMAELLEKSGQHKEAASAYGQAAGQSPRAGEFRLRQASALLAANAPSAARDVMEQYVEANPTDAAGLSLLVEAQRQAHDLPAAEATARRLIALEPKGVRGPYALALVYEAQRNYLKVIDVLAPVANATTIDPRVRSSRAFLGLVARLGYAYQEVGDFDKAIATFEAAKALAPADEVTDLYLAQAHMVAGHHARAAEIARAGRERRPDDDRFLRLQAQALREGGQVDEAVALLREQTATGTASSAIYLSLATAFGEAKRWEEADSVLGEAERRFPDEIDVPFQRGALLEQQKRYVEAERVFREVLKRDPVHAPTLNYLGYMLADRGERIDEAIRLITLALEADPHNGSYLDSLGWAWFRKGDAAKARPYLDTAAAQLPRNSVVQDHHGDVLRALGDAAGAIAAWERAVAGDGEQVDLDDIRRKIDDARRKR